MSLTVLSVAYPLAAVGPDAAGGSEQVLFAIDRALLAAGHRSMVVAHADSRIHGELVAVAGEPGPFDDAAKARAHGRVADALRQVAERERIDVIHLHGIDFANHRPPSGPTVVATLHLPVDWYPPWIFTERRPAEFLIPVSHAQASTCPRSDAVLPPILNGVPVEDLQARHADRGFALFLGRICPEKGVHIAIDAAKRANVPLLIAGEVHPYAEHERYFREEIVPRLDDRRRFIGTAGFARKRRLLTAARCLLVPSLVPETSSLVAREAAACGTPVVAFRIGALPETIIDERTGFVVDDEAGMAQAISKAGRIDPAICRAVARERFSLERMTGHYLDLYNRLAEVRAGAA